MFNFKEKSLLFSRNLKISSGNKFGRLSLPIASSLYKYYFSNLLSPFFCKIVCHANRLIRSIPHSRYHYYMYMYLHTNLSTYSPWRTKNPSLFFAARSRSVLAFFCKPSMMFRHSLGSLLNFSLSNSMARFIIASLMMFNSSLSAVLSPCSATTKYFPFSRLPLPKHKWTKNETCNRCCLPMQEFLFLINLTKNPTQNAVKP